jgi:hypothetical protein
MRDLLLLAVALIAAGCGAGQEPTRDPAVDAKGPVVNPLAPGAQSGGAGAPVSGGLYKAPPGMKTGVPK